MKKLIKKINWYVLIPAIFLLAFQLLSYYLAKVVNSGLSESDYHIIKWSIDDKIPLIPVTGIIYFGCYIWWEVSPLLMGKYVTKDMFYKFFLTTIIVHIISFLFFVLLPTWMVRPEASEATGPFSFLIKMIYGSDIPSNLLPSMHSTVSWLAVVPFLWNKESKIPKKLVVFQVFMAVLVFISTVTTRQHYLIDFIVAVILVEIVFHIVNRNTWHKSIEKKFTKINQKLGIEKIEND